MSSCSFVFATKNTEFFYINLTSKLALQVLVVMLRESAVLVGLGQTVPAISISGTSFFSTGVTSMSYHIAIGQNCYRYRRQDFWKICVLRRREDLFCLSVSPCSEDLKLKIIVLSSDNLKCILFLQRSSIVLAGLSSCRGASKPQAPPGVVRTDPP
jgi:hypothetical protein